MPIYLLKLDNGRWLTGMDVFGPPNDHRTRFTCGTVKAAKDTCRRYQEEYHKLGLEPPVVSLHRIGRSLTRQEVFVERLFYERPLPPGATGVSSPRPKRE